MRDHVLLYINGRRHRITGRAVFSSLADFLRHDLHLVGTKIGCAEGDCGACSVLVGRPDGDGLSYRPVTSCLLALHQLDGSHVVTVEGLGARGPTPVQEAMVGHHASQCGFCTPGFVVALSAVFEEGLTPDDDILKRALTGNLCRCTGYLPILDAGRSVDRARVRPLSELYPPGPIVEDLAAHASGPILAEVGPPEARAFFRPARLDEAIAFKAREPSAAIVSGGTELGVVRNRGGSEPAFLMSLAGIPGLSRIEHEGDVVSIGANVTWAQVEAYSREVMPEFHEVTRLFASPQIRNVATLVGNVAHASPIADSTTYLVIAGADVELISARGVRWVDIEAFHRGSKVTDIAPDEIITRVVIPLPAPGELVKLYKISRRKEMDISTFRAGIRIAADGGTIARAVIACSGVATTVRRLRDTEAFLRGRPLTEATFREAGRRARAEVEPISDVRGSRDHRLQLAENILLKFFFDRVEGRAREVAHA
jgi:xanthine dehydrogenase small subunit